MARPKQDPVEAALDRFFDLTSQQQAQFFREKQAIQTRLERILDRMALVDVDQSATVRTIQPEASKKRRGRPPKVQMKPLPATEPQT